MFRILPALVIAMVPFGGFAQLATKPLFWPDKQGPTRDSIVPEAEAEKLPLEWDEASGKGIEWRTAYEGEGHCSPVIGGDLVWFTSATKDGKKMYVYAINRHDGKVVHHKLVFENEAPEDLGNPLNNYAAPSCVLEEDAVYVHFGTYGTARLDPLTAEKVWERRDINARHFRGPGSSPALFGDLLVLTFDGIDKHFLTALNKKTGETVWLTNRSTDYKDLGPDGKPLLEGDYRKAYGTPTFAKVGEVDQLLSVGSRAAFGYEALTGKEIWTITHEEYNASSRPVVRDGVAYVNTGSGGAHLIAVKLDETTKGDVTKSHVLWDRDRRNSDLSSPLSINGYLFQVSGSGVGMCVDMKTGEDIWSERVSPGKFISAPLATKERLYFFSDAGFGTVVAAGPEFKVLAQNKFSEPVTASPAVADGALFVRTKTHLCKVVK
ncbi:quinonprotein alcohol dehydrogenase [Phragmitibacter flavus]|uniref:Quinonprotein alcohol dehydrogenase n=1 Tax=Phragmitibacter flavus TaxID=2576071 RepID=A0A5R8KJD7_9BACT|nr:PQQ-binding-like beta-propeller repeat protein [Phragmitibacter flavus]TLD72361.1 quinonprotein alcohol dehydrogenase [Phragmitibacter flavus]